MNDLLVEVTWDVGDDGLLLALDDLRVPAAVRAHALRLRTPARSVTDYGDGEYAIHAADGELLDLVHVD